MTPTDRTKLADRIEGSLEVGNATFKLGVSDARLAITALRAPEAADAGLERSIILALFNPMPDKHADGCLSRQNGPCQCGYAEVAGKYLWALREAKAIAADCYGKAEVDASRRLEEPREMVEAADAGAVALREMIAKYEARPQGVYSQFHLNNWSDADFAAHPAATRKTLEWLLKLETSPTAAGIAAPPANYGKQHLNGPAVDAIENAQDTDDGELDAAPPAVASPSIFDREVKFAEDWSAEPTLRELVVEYYLEHLGSKDEATAAAETYLNGLAELYDAPPAASADAVREADEAMKRIWSEWFTFYTKHFRGNVAISAADQMAFYEIAQPILRALSAPVAGAASPAQADMREREIIERCAKVAEGYCPVGALKHEGTKNGIAAAIRALPASGEADKSA